MQICLVTGGNSGVGLMTAVGLAKLGNHVFIACRSPNKAAKAVEYIRKITGNSNVEFLPLDLASLDSVRSCVNIFQQKNLPLHILVLNAGIFNHRGLTKEGFELIWGTNYLGHFLLVYLLLEIIQKSAPSRIILVASDLALRPHEIKWDSLVKKTHFNFLELYSVSKFCLLLLTKELSQQLTNSQVTVNAVHPGFVQSNITIWHQLSQYLGLGISPEDGAYSTLTCATSPKYQILSGKFLDSHAQEIILPKAVQNQELSQKLWERSLLWTGCHQETTQHAINYDGSDGIWGPYRLNLSSQNIAEIKDKIFDDILPNYPQKLLLNHLIKTIFKKDLGSFLMTLLQLSKRHFNMERHIDSSIIMQLCEDKTLLEKLSVHLGENLLLWRSEIWVNYPAKQMIPYWHQDCYPNLVKGKSKNIYAYIALTEVNEHNGFAYISNFDREQCRIKITDPFSGNNLFEIPEAITKTAIPVVLQPGEFVLFTDELMHCSLHNHSGKNRISLALRFTQSGTEIVPGYTSNYHQPVTLQLKNS
jgi:NAD(P)-dependent dehydrogenase (short-subunit alcohol dehydrogenase family)